MNLAGLILVSYGGRGIVELESGERLECKYRRSVGRPCCGDRVTVQHADDESTVVVAIEPRRNEFARADARQRRQVIAANLDRVLIVEDDPTQADFAGSILRRGVRVVQMPTTLLAQVDSAIGGKTAVNAVGLKNPVGTFHPAEAVLADTGFLAARLPW